LELQSISLDVNERRVHALVGGKGPAIMLFHASPMNSSSLMPLVSLLSDRYTVIAVDTPGYGKSEKPVQKPSNLSHYALVVEKLRQSLSIEKMSIYGTATGAQIGVRYALDFPTRVSHLFLDNVAHFSPELANEVMDLYFPDLTPREDGSHLPILWDNVVNLFQYFPWCWKESAYKLPSPLPPVEVLHKVAVLYLQAGASYDWAYRAAFEHERREYIAKLTVPTTIFRWDLSIVKAYTDQIFEIELPSNVEEFRIGADEDRYGKMAESIAAKKLDTELGISATLDDHILSVTKSKDMVAERSRGAESIRITPELSGQYLTNAWNSCQEENPQLELEEMNHMFINSMSKV